MHRNERYAHQCNEMGRGLEHCQGWCVKLEPMYLRSSDGQSLEARNTADDSNEAGTC
jgi:hypothetical protein